MTRKIRELLRVFNGGHLDYRSNAAADQECYSCVLRMLSLYWPKSRKRGRRRRRTRSWISHTFFTEAKTVSLLRPWGWIRLPRMSTKAPLDTKVNRAMTMLRERRVVKDRKVSEIP